MHLLCFNLPKARQTVWNSQPKPANVIWKSQRALVKMFGSLSLSPCVWLSELVFPSILVEILPDGDLPSAKASLHCHGNFCSPAAASPPLSGQVAAVPASPRLSICRPGCSAVMRQTAVKQTT